MIVIGLTGNIACGKSTVAKMLEALGACVIDADRLAHEAMRPGTAVHRAIVERFGEDILAEHGEIDRRKLGAIVFRDAEALADLERIVHPAVIAETLRRLAECHRPVAVVEAIKLLEAEMHRYCHRVWVVTCSRDQQMVRLMENRGLSAEEAEARIMAQPPQALKVARADVVIENSGALDETWRQVVRAWNALPGVPPAPTEAPWAGCEDMGRN
ncbi:MAG: dephospho-CoA kinase [Chloroflexi bacterium]|nr:dephospho-CoA kinase [Chloroflexota bacterium]